MPYLPYRDRNPTTGEWDGAGPINDFLQAALPQMCSSLRDTYRYQDANFSPGVNALNAPGRAIAEFVCSPYPYDPPDPPAVPPQPIWEVGGFSQGSITTRWRQTFPVVQTFDEVVDWDFPPDGNIGLPQASPRLDANGTGFLQVVLPTLRPGGEVQDDPVSSAYNPATFEFLGIFNYTVDGRDANDDPIPPAIILPPRTSYPPPDVQPVPRPVFPIEFNFPNVPGLPDFTFPVEYSPEVNLNGEVNFPLSFAPRTDISPSFSFAPRVEFGFGGLSITGGGYPETTGELREELSEACPDCDCPDPCPPAGDVDYPRIQTIVKNVVRTLNDLPGELSPAELGSEVTGEEVTLNLLPGAQGVNFSIDLTNYTGGASLGGSEDASVFYTGWYWFGRSAAQSSGDRQFFTSTNGFLPVPRNCRRFTAVMRDGAIITATAINQPTIPPEE